MNAVAGSFEVLSRVLFDGDVKASDIKTMPGTLENISQDEAAHALLDSMMRMGIVKDGVLINKNNP